MATKLVSLRLDSSLLAEIDKAAAGSRGRNKWCIQAFRDAMHKDTAPAELTTQETVQRQDTDKQMDLLLDEQILERMRGKNVLATLTDAEIAKLAVQRAPKAQNMDEKLLADTLSLTASLKLLPSVEDITGELSRLRQQYEKLKTEKEFQDAIVKVLRAKLKKDNPAAWDLFKAACEKLSERVNALGKAAEARMLEFEDLKGMI